MSAVTSTRCGHDTHTIAATTERCGDHGHTFDAAGWLADFTLLGGIYALGADRRLAFIGGGPCGPDLAEMVSEIMGEPGRQEALRTAIEQRQMAEAL